MSNYEPGTVAVATVRGVPNVRVAYADPEDREMPWMVLSGPEAGVWAGIVDVTDIRPLVVLDLPVGVVAHKMAEALRKYDFMWLADQIEQQTKPPRIPEPDLGKHVTAGKPDGTRAEFVRVGSRHWSEIGNGSGWEWADLIDPEAVSS